MRRHSSVGVKTARRSEVDYNHGTGEESAVADSNTLPKKYNLVKLLSLPLVRSIGLRLIGGFRLSSGIAFGIVRILGQHLFGTVQRIRLPNAAAVSIHVVAVLVVVVVLVVGLVLHVLRLLARSIAATTTTRSHPPIAIVLAVVVMVILAIVIVVAHLRVWRACTSNYLMETMEENRAQQARRATNHQSSEWVATGTGN